LNIHDAGENHDSWPQDGLLRCPVKKKPATAGRRRISGRKVGNETCLCHLDFAAQEQGRLDVPTESSPGWLVVGNASPAQDGSKDGHRINKKTQNTRNGA